MRKNKNLLESFNNAISGITHTIRSEHNMKLHITAAVIILIFSLFMNLSRLEFLIICMVITLVIICELFNTAIEAIVDMLAEEFHPKAKIAKDVAAGAVFTTAVFAVLAAYFIFFERVSAFIERGLAAYKQVPINIAIISLLVTLTLVLAIKAFFRRGTPMQGGMPSGHAATGFSITTAVALMTNNAQIIILVLFIALLLIQSRYEAKIHSLWELIAGAALGTIITLVLFQIFQGR